MEPTYVSPMKLGEVLDASFRLYRERFSLLVIAQSPMAVFYVLMVLVGMYSMGNDITDYTNISPVLLFLESLTKPYAGYTTPILYLVQMLIVKPLALSAVTKVASDSIVGSPSLKGAVQYAVKTLWKLGPTYIFLNIMLGGITLLLSLVCSCIGIIIVVFLWARWLLTIPVAVNENVFVIKAMNRSWNLVKKRTLNAFLAMVLVVLISIIMNVSPVLLQPFVGASLVVLMVVFGVLSEGFIVPLIDTTRVVIYFELRARKEGFDIEKRVETLTGGPPA